MEVADIIRSQRDAFVAYRGGGIPTAHRRILGDLAACRTAALGGHVEECDQCGHQVIAYNSCRNRHCPKCQGPAQRQWVAERERDLLPVDYFHIVFTVPAEIAALALQNKRVVYEILFRASADTLRDVAADPKHLGAKVGVLSVLHTWGQNLRHHPHIHCIVPGGGMSCDGTRWVACRRNFFLPVKVLGHLFRGKLLSQLKRAKQQQRLTFCGALAALESTEEFQAYLAPLYSKPWVVYAKPPFGGPVQVIKYLGRYTHRVAIANSRLVGMNDGNVSFRWKDYTNGCRRRIMTISATEFLRRFLLHALPKGFVRIRYYGFLANRYRKQKVEQCRELLAVHEPPKTTDAPGVASTLDPVCQPQPCPVCGRGTLRCISIFGPRRGPPARLPPVGHAA